jgi:hypothetical protein
MMSKQPIQLLLMKNELISKLLLYFTTLNNNKHHLKLMSVVGKGGSGTPTNDLVSNRVIIMTTKSVKQGFIDRFVVCPKYVLANYFHILANYVKIFFLNNSFIKCIFSLDLKSELDKCVVFR